MAFLLSFQVFNYNRNWSTIHKHSDFLFCRQFGGEGGRGILSILLTKEKPAFRDSCY